MENIKINPYYINKKDIHSFFNINYESAIKPIYDRLLEINEFPRETLLNISYTKVISDYVRDNQVKYIIEYLINNSLIEGLLILAEMGFYFKDLKENRKLFHCKYSEYNVKISGTFGKNHFTCDTSYSKLSGRNRQLVFGYVNEIIGNEIKITPLLIGEKIIVTKDSPNLLYNSGLRVYPSMIDEFKEIDKGRPKTRIPDYDKNALKVMKTLSEATVKQYISEIIGESNIKKDWGGETNDLFTKNLHINGKQVRAAFILKGPAAFHEMSIKDLGKQGDQIVRLFNSPADLLVLQHCHYIKAEVERNMEAFSSTFYNVRRYLILDGVETYELLKAYGKI